MAIDLTNRFNINKVSPKHIITLTKNLRQYYDS